MIVAMWYFTSDRLRESEKNTKKCPVLFTGGVQESTNIGPEAITTCSLADTYPEARQSGPKIKNGKFDFMLC